MGLAEFLRQWQGGRLAGGIALSVLVHLLVLAALWWGPPPFPKATVKRGEPLIVELPEGQESPPPGRPAAPSAPSPATPARPPAPRQAPAAPPKVAATPTPSPRPPAPRAEAPRPQPPKPEPRAPQPAPERQVASTPVPTAPDGALPAPKAPEPTPPAPPPTAAHDAGPPPAPAPPAAPAPQAAPPQVAALPPSAPSRPAPDIRSLKGGGGGAGGSGEGRAGIEGEPIPLDSTDPRYSDYLDQVRRRIKAKWGYPCEKNPVTKECEYKTTDLMIEFGIAKDGNLMFVTVVRSSGHPIYDDYALNAIRLAGFPPIPDSFSKSGRVIVAQFNYVVQSSLTNILR